MHFEDFIPQLIAQFPQYDFDFRVNNSSDIILDVVKEPNIIGIIEKPSFRNDLFEKHLCYEPLIHIGNPTSPYWIFRESNSGMRLYQEEYIKNQNLH